MVQFNCTYCNRKLIVPDEHFGKQARCPHCKNTMIVPGTAKHNEESYVLAEDLGSKKHFIPKGKTEKLANAHGGNASSPSGIPRWTWILFGLLVVSLGILILYALMSRDTWEHDNFRKVLEMKSEAGLLAANGKTAQALDT